VDQLSVVPRCTLIAETTVIHDGLSAALNMLGVQDWQTDAATDAERLMEFAGKSCYLSLSPELNKNLTKVGTRNNQEYLQEGIIKPAHGSVLEHASVTAFFHNISRIVTHEQVRHRAGTAFSQTSGRYVRGEILMYYPRILETYGEKAKNVFRRAISQMEENVRELEQITGINGMKDFGLKKKLTSAFRRLIGNGQANHLVFTANHRAWRHIIEIRTSRHAEEEIRLVVGQAAEQLAARYPAIYADMTAEMVDGFHEYTFKHRKV